MEPQSKIRSELFERKVELSTTGMYVQNQVSRGTKKLEMRGRKLERSSIVLVSCLPCMV